MKARSDEEHPSAGGHDVVPCRPGAGGDTLALCAPCDSYSFAFSPSWSVSREMSCGITACAMSMSEGTGLMISSFRWMDEVFPICLGPVEEHISTAQTCGRNLVHRRQGWVGRREGLDSSHVGRVAIMPTR